MIFERIEPRSSLSHIIQCFWHVDSLDDTTPQRQKIIPDGSPEIIFHYGDPYKTNISGSWEMQEMQLLAGQIRNHFHLENTGHSGMIGIKFIPTALTRLFGIDMSQVTDQVVSLNSKIPDFPKVTLSNVDNKQEFINEIQYNFEKLLPSKEDNSHIETAVSHLLKAKGLISIADLCKLVDLSERQLERLFAKYVGLSPKFYCRVIRMKYVFELMQANDNSWSDLVYQSGFYDQSHFIKNFKEFTGEDPTNYGFSIENMANFHLKE